MQAQDYLSHIRAMGAIRALGPRQRRFWEELLVMAWIWQQPCSSPGDLLAHGVIPQARIYDILGGLRNGGHLNACTLGGTKSRQSRYVPTLKGVTFVRERLGWALEWQVTQAGLERISRYLPFLESVYPLAPRLWMSNAAVPLRYHLSPDPDRDDEVIFDEACRMYRFIWVRYNQGRGQNPVHAIAQYVADDGEDVSVPFIWYGSLHGTEHLGDLNEVFLGLQAPGHPPHANAPRPTPPGIVVVCDDLLAALRVRREYDPAVPKAVITACGKVTEVLRPLPPRGWFRAIDQPAGRRERAPDGTTEWLSGSPHAQALGSVETNRIVRWVEHYPGSLITQIARGVRLRRSAVREALDLMILHDLVRELESGFYLGEAGILFIARRDRESPNTAKARFSTYIDEKGQYRAQQRRHDRRVADVAIALQEAGMPPFTGRRLVVNYPGLTQIKSDLWCALPRGDGSVMFAAVEVEFSAQKDEAATKKLTPYRRAQSEAGEPCPAFFVTGTAAAADRFAQLGDDLPMLVASFDEVIKNSPAGPIWRWRGQRVPAAFLLNLCDRDDFRLPAGRMLEYRPLA